MDRRIKKTNLAIYKAYIELRKEHPEAAPSVKEICAKADINKTTFYRYFTDIESLARSLTERAINKLLVEDIDVATLLSQPEFYFRQILTRFKSYENDLKSLLYGNANTFIFEAEKILKDKLKEKSAKYDEVLCTFIAGGAAHYFLSANYNDEEELQKFCSIIKAATAAFGK